MVMLKSTYHLKLDYFFGADLKKEKRIQHLQLDKNINSKSTQIFRTQHKTHHCANFLLAIRRSDETFIVCWLKRLCVALSGHRLGPPIICKREETHIALTA